MRSRRRSAFAIAAVLTGLAAAGQGCSDEETSVLLTFEGDGSAARTLNVRLVGTGGALPRTFTLPENASQALKLPGTVLVKANPGAVGVMAWLEDANRQPVAAARTFGCLVARAGKQTTFTLRLETPPVGWTTQTVEGCACSATMPTDDMCAPRANTGGTGGSATGGTGGSVGVGGAGGASGGSGGSGGSQMVDAGMGGAGNGGAAGLGGSGGAGGSSMVDAGPPTPVGPLFGFEMAGQWTINGQPLGLDAVIFNEGKSSGTFVGQPGKKVLIESPVFATSMLSGVTTKLTLDVYVSEMQDFADAIALVVNVPSAAVYNQYVMRVETRPLKVNMWNTITFTLPAAVVTALQGNHTDARFTFEHEGRGTARYDRVAFAP